MKKEDDIYEGCTLAVISTIGAFFNLNNRIFT